MIDRLMVENFKSIGSLDVPLSRLTVIIGPNASGKTSILDAIDVIHRAPRVSLHKALWVERHAPDFVRRGGEEKTIRLQLTSNNNKLGLLIYPPNVKHLNSEIDTRWMGYFIDQQPQSIHLIKEKNEHLKNEVISIALGEAVLLQINPHVTAKPSYTEQEIARVGVDGRGLASVVATMAMSQPDRLAELTESARAIIPGLKRIRSRRHQIERTLHIDNFVPQDIRDKVMGEQLVLDMDGASDIPAHLVSQGTLMVIALLTVIHAEPRPKMLLLDDIEQGLHPRAQKELIALLRRLMARPEYSDLQIVATTHSPYLIDHLTPDEILVTTYSAERGTLCRPLREHPELAQWIDVMKPGEFWGMVGEEWVAEGAR
jgi:predicted ATPase